MKIERVRIRRYRCLKDLVLHVDDSTALVGPNGSGKSSVLYALDWFFNGGTLTAGDLHSTQGGADGDSDEIAVEVTFTDLTAEDRAILGPYGRAEKATFRRSWSFVDGKEKMIGNARQGPGFAAIRTSPSIVDIRAQYQQLRAAYPALTDVMKKDDIFAQLDIWESDPANTQLLVEVPAVDATHMFGFNGEHVLARRARFVLVPASSVIADQVSMSGRTSAVGRLIGALISEAVAAARGKWESDNQEELTKLRDGIKLGVARATEQQTDRVNRMLTELVPTAAIEFVPEVPSWSVKGDASVQTDVLLAGERRDVGRQGHGIQRAVMIAILQALVGEGAGGDVATVQDHETAASGDGATAFPALVICIEEPEIYQHPVRARHFARVLQQWSKRAGSQVVFATHSPYFVLPEQFASLRRFALVDGSTRVESTTVGAVAAAAGVDGAKVQRVVEKELPRPFSEGFFADAVVFVEGDTDRVVLEEVAERLGLSLDTRGIAVLAMGSKENLKVPFALLRLLGVPVYVVADGDADGAEKRYPSDSRKRAEAAGSHKLATDALVAWLPEARFALAGVLPYEWGGATTVTDRWCVWRDDLEAELESWPAYMTALGSNGEQLRSKNVAAARAAATEADLGSLPNALRKLVQALATFA